jgi:hypothetical protein
MTRVLWILLSSLPFAALAQVDYLEYKHKYDLSCGSADSSVIARNQVLVDSLQSFAIVNGEKQYLYDYGWVYYMKYTKWQHLDDARTAASSFEKGWEQHKDLNALWNLGGLYRVLGDCGKSLDITELYLQEAPDSTDVDYQQIYYRYKFCRGKE